MFPKGPTGKELKSEKQRELARGEDRENVKVKERSGGRCEHVYGVGLRCPAPAVHIHHILKGLGVRGRGPSALAENKLHLCFIHHIREHGHV